MFKDYRACFWDTLYMCILFFVWIILIRVYKTKMFVFRYMDNWNCSNLIFLVDFSAKINAIQVKTSDDQWAGCEYPSCKLTLRVFSSKVRFKKRFFLEIMDIPFRIVAPMAWVIKYLIMDLWQYLEQEHVGARYIILTWTFLWPSLTRVLMVGSPTGLRLHLIMAKLFNAIWGKKCSRKRLAKRKSLGAVLVNRLLFERKHDFINLKV